MTQEHVFPDRVAYLHCLMEACDQLEAMGLLETIGIDPVTGVKRRRSEILAEVEPLASARLFGLGPWLGEDSDQLCKWFMQVGLAEPVPGEKDTWRATVLGRELHVD